MRTPVIILGSGGFAREVLNWIDHTKYDLKAFYSETESGSILRVPIINDLDRLNKKFRYIIGVGSPKLKKKLVKKLHDSGFYFPCDPIIHPSAIKGTEVTIGKGSVVCPQAVITTNCLVGDFVTVNLGSTIGHDCIIGNYVNISPGANISGNCIIRDLVDIGTNSCIRQGLSIGDNSTLGMGAVLTKQMPHESVWVGNPARPISDK